MSIPEFYFNGFSTGVAGGDVTFTLKNGDEDIVVLRCSHILAKTLGVKTSEIMQQLETALGQKIMTTDETTEAMRKLASQITKKNTKKKVKKKLRKKTLN